MGRVVAALEAAGYLRGDESAHSIELYDEGDRVPVELHWWLEVDGASMPDEVWERVIPLRGADGLLQLGRVDQVTHLGRHAVLNHRIRGIQLRDLVVIGAAAAHCGDPELRPAHEALAAQDHARRLLEAFAFARRLHDGAPSPRERWEPSTIAYYLAWELGFARRRLRDNGPHGSWRYAALESGRWSLAELVREGLGPIWSAPPRLGHLLSDWPRLGPVIVRVARTAWYLTSGDGPATHRRAASRGASPADRAGCSSLSSTAARATASRSE
jgi:hypothetical protein